MLKNNKITIQFEGDTYYPAVTTYADGNIALMLVPATSKNDDDDSTAIVASTNVIEECQLASGEIAIKNYSGHEQIPALLQAAGIIGPQKYTVPSGYVDIPVFDLLILQPVKP